MFVECVVKNTWTSLQVYLNPLRPWKSFEMHLQVVCLWLHGAFCVKHIYRYYNCLDAKNSTSHCSVNGQSVVSRLLVKFFYFSSKLCKWNGIQYHLTICYCHHWSAWMINQPLTGRTGRLKLAFHLPVVQGKRKESSSEQFALKMVPLMDKIQRTHWCSEYLNIRKVKTVVLTIPTGAGFCESTLLKFDGKQRYNIIQQWWTDSTAGDIHLMVISVNFFCVKGFEWNNHDLIVNP